MKKIIGFLVYIVILFGLQSCIKTQTESLVKEMIIPTNVSGERLPFPTTYFVPPEFNDIEFQLMEEGIDEWNKATNGIVKINLQRWTPKTEFTPEYYCYYKEKTIWKKYSTDEITKQIFYHMRTDTCRTKKNKNSKFAGLSCGNYILLIEDYLPTDIRFKTVFKHELGHQLSLEHTKDNYPSIMSRDAGSNKITKWDILQFCSIYSCR